LLKLPMTIGLMLISLLFSLSLIIASHLGLNFAAQADAIIKRIDFNRAFMQGMLSFLLFAGALHVNFDNLLQQKWTIGTFATIGVLISTVLIGSAMYVLLAWIGLPLSLLHCLLFGALVSPTDPIAVLGLLKQNLASHPISAVHP
jgi:monovalent cation:H+ antiporter, CPA1 family